LAEKKNTQQHVNYAIPRKCLISINEAIASRTVKILKTNLPLG